MGAPAPVLRTLSRSSVFPASGAGFRGEWNESLSRFMISAGKSTLPLARRSLDGLRRSLARCIDDASGQSCCVYRVSVSPRQPYGGRASV